MATKNRQNVWHGGRAERLESAEHEAESGRRPPVGSCLSLVMHSASWHTHKPGKTTRVSTYFAPKWLRAKP